MSILDALFPKESLTGEVGQWITSEERSQLLCSPIVERRCGLRARGVTYLDRLVSAAMYRSSPVLQKAICTCKYKRVPGLIADLSSLMLEAIEEKGTRVTVVCPVPLHWSRSFMRGFNQAELLCRDIAQGKQFFCRSVYAEHALQDIKHGGTKRRDGGLWNTHLLCELPSVFPEK